MQRELVDLDHDAVDLVLDVVPVLAVMVDEVQHTPDVVSRAEVRARRETPFREKAVDLALRVDGRTAPRPDAVHEQTQRVQARLAGLPLQAVLLVELLPETAGSRVARIGERREAPFRARSRLRLVERTATGTGLFDGTAAHVGLERVEALERGDGDEHLAANLDEIRMTAPRQTLRDAGDPDRVDRDVLAGPPVSARRGRGQHSALVAQADRESVDLELGQPAHLAPRGRLGLGAPLAKLFEAEDVVEAQHPLGVLHRGEHGALGRPDGLGRRVLTLQLRVQALEFFQPADPRVVRRVVHELRVATVIGVARVEDALGQLPRLGP